MRASHGVLTWALLCGLCAGAGAQLATRGVAGPAPQKVAPHRTRLILKDGSYQVVMSFAIVGKNVRYVSAERGGETEEVPLTLVDMEATRRWDAQHAAVDPDAPPEARPAPALDPELVKEERERAETAPEVAPDLHLAPEDAVLALDTFRATPELVPLFQTDGELNKQTGHSILRGVVNPSSATHQLLIIKGERAAVQMHVNDPAFFLKLDDAMGPSGEPLTVDTGGASSHGGGRKQESGSDYVIVRVEVRQDARVVASFSTSALGTVKKQEDVIEVTTTVLPGGHWLKIEPKEALLVGEYALMEVLDAKSVNLGVWDFGVHPTAVENRDVIRPEKKRPVTLERRNRN